MSSGGCIMYYMLNLEKKKKTHKEAAKDIKYCHPYLKMGSQGWGKFGNKAGIQHNGVDGGQRILL